MQKLQIQKNFYKLGRTKKITNAKELLKTRENKKENNKIKN